MVANPEQDFVLKTVESRDVHFVRFWFTDVLGNMKSFAVVPGELESAFEEGMGFDASCIEGFSAAQESDMLAFPDPSTFEILPWRPQANAVARMICDIRMLEGEPYAGDSRHVLERVVRRAAEAGYSFIVGPELEYFYFKDAEGTQVLDHGSYFDLTSLDSASDLRRDTVLTLEKMGIPVEYSHHEKGPSQHEIDLRYADALSMADAVMTYKQVVKEIAMKHGVYASFMPKPMADAPGNGMHVHQSLMDRSGNNVFFDLDDPSGYNLSATAKSYIAGLFQVRSGVHAGHEPVRELLQAPAAGRGGAHLHQLGRAQPRRPSCASRATGRTARRPAAWSCAARPGGEPLPGLRRHAGRGPGGHRGGA